MSWYTSFYIGWQDKEGKIYPLGVYDNKGRLKCVHETSRSFTTDLKDMFHPIKDEMISEELRKEFEEYYKEPEFRQYFEYLPKSELPKGLYVKSGYYLLEEINVYLAYINNQIDYFEGFYDVLTPTEYALKLENELKFGKPEPKYDCEGCEITQHTCSEYAYFSYPDYNCKEWEAFWLRSVADILAEDWDLKDGERIVIFKTEG